MDAKQKLLKKVGIITMILLVTGGIRIGWQGGLLDRMQAEGFHPEPKKTDVMSQLGVEAAVGALGGLRYLVASMLELKAVDHWEESEWEELYETYFLVTLLQPKESEAWRAACLHTAYNAVAYYQIDAEHLPPQVRKEKAALFLKRGKQFLIDGQDWNPDDYWLNRDLAYIYKDKDKDPCAAATEFLKGARQPNAPEFLLRFYGYEGAKCPGMEEDVYKVLKPLYDRGFSFLTRAKSENRPPQTIDELIKLFWKPSLITTIKDLEEKLNIPENQRIKETWDSVAFRINTPFRVENNSETTER
ncbi:MAG: hypothetical protein AAF585_19205 [Verrucomicrobiota bacterium]